MGLFLRKRRVSKRTSEPTQKQVNSAASSSSTLLAALDHLHQSPIASKENMEPTPPPPPPMLPRKPEKLRCSPSKSLLHRYKGRASMDGAATTPTPAKGTTTAPAASNVTTRLRTRIPAFTEDFEHSKSSVELTSPSRAVSALPTNSSIRTVSGVEFQMVNALQPSPGLPQRSKSAEPARVRSTDEDGEEDNIVQASRQRETRSKTREGRSDSTVGDLGGNATKSQETTARPLIPEAESERAGSTLRKKNSNPSLAPRPKIPRVTRSSTAERERNITPTKITAQFVDSSSSDSSDSDDSDCGFILDSNVATVRDSLRKADRHIEPTRVVPPVHIGSTLPGMLWASSLSGTSRPDSPWLWCKRWTCCRCSASTIVEQQVCARLACGHHRCGNQCKVARDKRLYLV